MSKDDRRAAKRLPIERDVRYKVLGLRGQVKEVGLGRTINMSRSGVLFTTESILLSGARVELSISWPVLIDKFTPIKLVASGNVVRVESGQAAIAIQKYEFKTAGFRDH